MIIRPSMSGIFEKNIEPPLDISGMPTARLAYGLRLLRAAYTGAAIRVRRDSDSTEADVYFYNQKEVTLNSMTSAGSTLRDFVGSNSAFVTKWYNQSAETTKPDAVQTTTSRQPELISSGVFNRGLKCVTSGGFSAAGDYLQVNSYRLPNSPDDFTLVMVCEVFDFTGVGGLISNLDNFNDGAEMIYLTGGSYRLALDAFDEDSASGYPTYTRTIVSSTYDRGRSSAQGGDGKSMIVRVSGTETTRDVNEDKHVGRTDRFRIGCRKINNNPFNGIIREVFVWESAVSDALQLLLEDNLAIYNEVDLS
jgi:hypothetical protein